MPLTRKTAQILCRLLMVAWMSVFVFGVLEGCLAQEETAFGVFSGQAASSATATDAGHGASDTGHGLVCKRYCQSVVSPIKFEQTASIPSVNVFPLLFWATLPFLSLGMASAVLPISRPRLGAVTGSATRPHLLFHRLNN